VTERREYQVIFAGEGGQGLVVAGSLLGEAAVSAGWYATQTVEYGIASRGGLALTEVKLSDREIDCPELTQPDYLMVLTTEAYRRLAERAAGAVLIYDRDLVGVGVAPAAGRLLGYPLTTALRRLTATYGEQARINILALGVLLGVEPLVPLETVEQVLAARFGAAGAAANRAVLRAGVELARTGR